MLLALVSAGEFVREEPAAAGALLGVAQRSIRAKSHAVARRGERALSG
jgi:hypothetical protein